MILSLAAMAAASCSAGEEVANIINHSKRSKRSKRILAARAFLKSITLDGGTLQEESQTARPKSLGDIPPVKNGPKKTLRIDHDTIEDDRKLISAIPSTSKAQLHHSTSIASTNVFEEGAHAREIENVRVPKSRSYVDTTSVSSSSKDRQISRLLSPRVHTYEAHQYHARSTKHMLGKRTVMASCNAIPLGSMSIIPYRKESQSLKEKRISGSLQLVHSHSVLIEGVEIGDGKTTVSYSHMLVPVNFTRRKRALHSQDHDNIVYSTRDHAESVYEPYNPFFLDDPELTSGKHRKVLNLKSYTVSVIQYAKPSEIKKDINERFKEKFPNANITLSKLRSIKTDMLEMGVKCGIDRATISCAHIYFEKLVLKEKITKANRKYCAGACLLLAAKFYEDIKKGNFSSIIEVILDSFRLHLKDLLACELLVLIGLEFSLFLPPEEVNPMYKRLENIKVVTKSKDTNHHNHKRTRRTPRNSKEKK